MAPAAAPGPPSADDFEARALAVIGAAVPDADAALAKAMIGMSRVNSRLTADFESLVHRPRGLSWAGFRTLFCLWAVGPLQTGDLARLLFTTAPTVSSVVNTLEGRGWVQRVRLDQDRRLVEVRLTASGGRLVRRAYKEQHERQKAWARDIDPADLAGFVRVVEHLATRPRPEIPAGAVPRHEAEGA
jgi:DNA-binding MarR family transcriptional regulator